MHKLIILGNLLDRGTENEELISFILRMIDEDMVILIRGNHEDLFETLIDDLLYNEDEQYRIVSQKVPIRTCLKRDMTVIQSTQALLTALLSKIKFS